MNLPAEPFAERISHPMSDGTLSVRSFFQLIQKSRPNASNNLYVRYVSKQDVADGLSPACRFLLVLNTAVSSNGHSITFCCPTTVGKCALWKIKITHDLIIGQMTDAAGIDPSEGLDMFAPIFLDGLIRDDLVVKNSDTKKSDLAVDITYDLGSYKTVGTFEVSLDCFRIEFYCVCICLTMIRPIMNPSIRFLYSKTISISQSTIR